MAIQVADIPGFSQMLIILTTFRSRLMNHKQQDRVNPYAGTGFYQSFSKIYPVIFLEFTLMKVFGIGSYFVS